MADPERWGFLMPHRVAWWIYRHAFVLLVRKGLSFYGHPKSQPGVDYRAAPAAAAQRAGWPACPVLAARAGAPAPARPYVWHDANEAPWT